MVAELRLGRSAPNDADGPMGRPLHCDRGSIGVPDFVAEDGVRPAPSTAIVRNCGFSPGALTGGLDEVIEFAGGIRRSLCICVNGDGRAPFAGQALNRLTGSDLVVPVHGCHREVLLDRYGWHFPPG